MQYKYYVIIPDMFDFWADQVVHLLLPKSSMGKATPSPIQWLLLLRVSNSDNISFYSSAPRADNAQ